MPAVMEFLKPCMKAEDFALLERFHKAVVEDLKQKSSTQGYTFHTSSKFLDTKNHSTVDDTPPSATTTEEDALIQELLPQAKALLM